MSLRTFPALVQGSQEWLDQRRGMLTASEMGGLITPKTVKVAQNVDSRALAARLVAERITGWTDPTYIGDDMLRGIEDEPRAREKYAETYAPVTELGFMVRTITVGEGDETRQIDIGYSPDGLVADVGIIEVKSRRQDKHVQTVLTGDVPAEFMAQIQTGLLVSGREWCDFISYSGGMHMWVKRVWPDETWQAAIIEAATALENAADVMVRDYRIATRGMPMTERVVEVEMTF